MKDDSCNIYFYEVYASNYNRYVIKVAAELLRKDADLKLFFIIEAYDKGEINAFSDKVTVISAREVPYYSKIYKPSMFVNFGFRIPDLYWTLYFKKQGSSTIHVQHGIYIDHFRRLANSFVDDIGRRLRYVYYLLKTIGIASNTLNTLKAMVTKDFKLKYDKSNIDKRIVSDKVITWGAYWESWYKENLFYDEQVEFHICGGFDYYLLKDKNSFRGEPDSVAYICQSLIEDGRLSQDYFSKFIDNFVSFSRSSGKCIYIKLHPRSNRKLYERLEQLENVVLCDSFPITEFYIGHYSTLLVLCHYLESNILLVEFPKHAPPDIIKSIATGRVSYDEEIKFKKKRPQDKAPVEFYCQYTSNPYEEIAAVVLNQTA